MTAKDLSRDRVSAHTLLGVTIEFGYDRLGAMPFLRHSIFGVPSRTPGWVLGVYFCPMVVRNHAL